MSLRRKRKKDSDKSYWKNQCDQVFSKIVRMRADGRCEETNARADLQCAHIISRRFQATRYDLDNAVCLCGARHRFYTVHPVAWRQYIFDKIGEDKLEQLEVRALEIRSRTLEDYKELYERLETLYNSFDRRSGKFQSGDNPGREL